MMTNAEVTAFELELEEAMACEPTLVATLAKVDQMFPPKQECFICGFRTRNRIELDQLVPVCGDCYNKGDQHPEKIKTVAQAIELLRE